MIRPKKIKCSLNKMSRKMDPSGTPQITGGDEVEKSTFQQTRFCNIVWMWIKIKKNTILNPGLTPESIYKNVMTKPYEKLKKGLSSV